MWRTAHLASQSSLLSVWLVAAVHNNSPHLAPQNQNSNTLRGAGNGLGRTQRIHNAGCPSGRALQVQMASINKGKKRQKDPIPTAGPIQVLTQVLQLVQILPLDPQVKEQLQVSLRGHVEPMLQPKKSTVELVVEKETLHSQQSSALAAKKVEYDQLLADAQAVAHDMIVTLENVANMKQSCKLYRPNCCNLHCAVCNRRLNTFNLWVHWLNGTWVLHLSAKMMCTT